MAQAFDIGNWLSDEALEDAEPPALLEALCHRLTGLGFPILRVQIAFPMLHPLYQASILSWSPDGGMISTQMTAEEGTQERFLRSPIAFALARGASTIRRRLTGPEARLDFPVLEELRARGGTDYLLVPVSFEPTGTNGVMCSWVADRPSGFSNPEIDALTHIARQLAIAIRAKIERRIARNLAHVYLGERAGSAVLNGLIKRGDGEKLAVALWYSDLRGSTRLADSMTTESFLDLLGRYFEMTAGPVLDQGGEVVSLIGDAVLAIFRTDEAEASACPRALLAARQARRLHRASSEGRERPEFDFGISLHQGTVLYGNLGVPERLQFTVVGSAVNEVVRLQDLTKSLDAPIVASDAFVRASSASWQPLGIHALRGVQVPVSVWRPDDLD
ncbi:adenylate/guanylate cyclase domain-containing protein [Reyranella sp.]|uniref:adenylate/guanylate cyclase domain-containing protein n=1 Tax=Reyranella sp. TaxID=1929291 RepID=UPI003BACA334